MAVRVLAQDGYGSKPIAAGLNRAINAGLTFCGGTGFGATVGSVIPTRKAIIPAAVGVDIGCGMAAMHTTLTASELPDKVSAFRSAIEKAVPHGRSHHGRRGDNGSFRDAPRRNAVAWRMLRDGYERVLDKHPQLDRNTHPANQLGTLGIGNHFIEVCLDESDDVWFVLHSGSRASCPKTQTNSRPARRDVSD